MKGLCEGGNGTVEMENGAKGDVMGRNDCASG